VVVLSVVGARPQFVKAAVVSAALRRHHREILVHTGQHYDDEMSARFFRELGIPTPDYHLGIGSGTHGEQTGRMLPALEQVLVREKPTIVLVYGDTNSTLAGALAAAKLNVPVAHVEAGCRSYDRTMPEEVNRVLTDHVAALLFCPTARAVAQLADEGVTRGVHHVGDVMLDLLRQRLPHIEARSRVVEELQLAPRGYVAVTIHRAANTDQSDRLASILEALEAIAEPVVFPVHPRTRQAIAARSASLAPHVRLIDPLGYDDMVALMRHARMVLTDSGGVQKEALYVGTPCLTLRETTEWPETIEAGWNRLVGADRDAIVAAVRSFTPGGVPDTRAFGEGRAAVRIAELLDAWD
jgi:UDP-GlcNAc3NAcA epimerase